MEVYPNYSSDLSYASAFALTALTAFAVYFWWIGNPVNKNDDDSSKLQERIEMLEKRRKLEVDYYTTVIHNLETTNKTVQEEAQALRVSAVRFRNLYDRKASFMSKAELEKAITEVSQRLASMRSSLVDIKNSISAGITGIHECQICANTFKHKNKIYSCGNNKCSYGWCNACDDKLKCTGVKLCPAGCQGEIL
jgi:hypothetical protein